MWRAALARFEEPRDLADLLPHRLGEPAAGDDVVQAAQGSPPHLDLLHVVNAGAAFDLVDLEPGMDRSRHAALEAHVDAVRRLPAVARDHGARQEAEELAVLARDHAVRRVR